MNDDVAQEPWRPTPKWMAKHGIARIERREMAAMDEGDEYHDPLVMFALHGVDGLHAQWAVSRSQLTDAAFDIEAECWWLLKEKLVAAREANATANATRDAEPAKSEEESQ